MSKIDHIGVVVNSIENALKLYSGLLDVEPDHEEVIESRGLKVCFIKMGDTMIELLQPIRDDSEVSKYLEKKGEGLHHLAYTVTDIQSKIEKAKELGLKPLSDEPKPGAHNTLAVFLHPKTTNGVLTELVQY